MKNNYIKDKIVSNYWKLMSLFVSDNFNKNKYIVTECYFKKSGNNFVKHNWGDDLNKFLFEYVTKRKVYNIPFTSRKIEPTKNTYSLIGSILNFYNLNNKIVYGSGIIDPDRDVKGVPNKIISVRGPKTRDVLLSKGIQCEPNYGDPALLLPLFYKANCKKEDTVGLIFNMGTKQANDVIDKLSNRYKLKIISMTKYDTWTDVIDDINSCKFILSESLHGLILAETYGIPNIWIECQDHPMYWEFKFKDYFESIGKDEQILKLQDSFNINDIDKMVIAWKKGAIDYTSLLELFPFEIKCELNKL